MWHSQWWGSAFRILRVSLHLQGLKQDKIAMFQPYPPACQSHEVIFLQWTWIVILNTLLTTVATEESDLVFQPQFSFQNKKKKKKGFKAIFEPRCETKLTRHLGYLTSRLSCWLSPWTFWWNIQLMRLHTWLEPLILDSYGRPKCSCILSWAKVCAVANSNLEL